MHKTLMQRSNFPLVGVQSNRRMTVILNRSLGFKLKVASSKMFPIACSILFPLSRNLGISIVTFVTRPWVVVDVLNATDFVADALTARAIEKPEA